MALRGAHLGGKHPVRCQEKKASLAKAFCSMESEQIVVLNKLIFWDGGRFCGAQLVVGLSVLATSSKALTQWCLNIVDKMTRYGGVCLSEVLLYQNGKEYLYLWR